MFHCENPYHPTHMARGHTSQTGKLNEHCDCGSRSYTYSGMKNDRKFVSNVQPENTARLPHDPKASHGEGKR